MTVRRIVLSLAILAALVIPSSAQQTPLRSPDVIFVPTPQEVVDAMLKLAKVTKNDVVYDLGSGDGRIPITAAKAYGARGVGIDIHLHEAGPLGLFEMDMILERTQALGLGGRVVVSHAFCLGDATPARVRRIMLSTLLAQVVIAVTTTFARLEGPDGKPGSSLALGFLVPMLGFGLNGLWAAYHGNVPRREDAVPE